MILPSTLHRYAYVVNNPTNFSDPNGRLPTAVVGAIGGFVTGGVIGGGIGLVTSAWQGNSWDLILRDAGIGAASGAVSGTVAGGLIGMGVAFYCPSCVGAAASVAGQATENFFRPASEDKSLIAAGITGAIVGHFIFTSIPVIPKGAFGVSSLGTFFFGSSGDVAWSVGARFGAFELVGSIISKSLSTFTNPAPVYAGGK